MIIDIEHKRVSDLHANTRKRLSKLCFRSGSVLKGFLKNPDAHAFIARNSKGKIIAWAGVEQDALDWRDLTRVWDAHFYTQVPYRRRGVARILADEVITYFIQLNKKLQIDNRIDLPRMLDKRDLDILDI